MDGEDKKALAKKMAAERSKPTQRKPLAGSNTQQTARGGSLSFFGDEADGWNMSPKSILLFSVAYMGCVILLHIFGKISNMKTGKTPDAPEPGPDTGAGDL